MKQTVVLFLDGHSDDIKQFGSWLAGHKLVQQSSTISGTQKIEIWPEGDFAVSEQEAEEVKPWSDDRDELDKPPPLLFPEERA